MHARGWILGVLGSAVIGMAASAAADPSPKPVDIKARKAQATVLADAQGGVYVVLRDGDEPKVFYGPNPRAVYEQIIIGSSSDGEGRWEFDTWAPRVPGNHLGFLTHKKDGSFERSCSDSDKAGLTELTGDKAHAVLDKAAFLTMGTVRVPHLLARDDSGVYYYVDRIAKQYGGKGYRVFVGRKGAMKQVPLTDVASDSAGEVFSTKSGDLRLVRNNENDKQRMTWVKGEKRTELVFLDTDENSVVIFKDLGLYTFLGTLCDNV